MSIYVNKVKPNKKESKPAPETEEVKEVKKETKKK